jgi:uncharacterized membrane protein YfhO
VREAWLTDATLAAPTPTARVTAVEIGDDVRHYAVEAPDGGVLVLRERAHAGWHVQIDGRETPVTVANAVLMAVAVPPGSRTVVAEFRQPLLRPSIGITCLAAAGIALAFILERRRVRRR